MVRSGCATPMVNRKLMEAIAPYFAAPAPSGPGTSRLARRLTTILPSMTLADTLETTRMHRVASLSDDRLALVTTRPSGVGVILGGHVPMPGVGSRAHHGVLCPDELPACTRHVLEGLRQPLEKGMNLSH
jgi:magnesium chelatase family protein